jgi:formylglycine-generating enzyme required for sulfatase activity
VEWEYAASGYENLGYSQKYAGCDTKDQLGEYAWYYDNASNRVHQVATRKPNTHGLYDMSGNVMEWCWDEYSNNIESFAGQKDPYNLGFSKRIRAEKIHASDAFLPSGSWGSFELFCEVSCRHNFVTSYDNYFVGFRLVRTR